MTSEVERNEGGKKVDRAYKLFIDESDGLQKIPLRKRRRKNSPTRYEVKPFVGSSSFFISYDVAAEVKHDATEVCHRQYRYLNL